MRPGATGLRRRATSALSEAVLSINWSIVDQYNVLQAIHAYYRAQGRENGRRMYGDLMELYLQDLAGVCAVLRATPRLRWHQSDIYSAIRSGTTTFFSEKVEKVIRGARSIPLEFPTAASARLEELHSMSALYLDGIRKMYRGSESYTYEKALEEVVCSYVIDIRVCNKVLRREGVALPELTTADILEPSGKPKSQCVTTLMRKLISALKPSSTRPKTPSMSDEEVTLRLHDLVADAPQAGLESSAGANQTRRMRRSLSAGSVARGTGTAPTSTTDKEPSLFGITMRESFEQFAEMQVERYRDRAKDLHSTLRAKDLELQEAQATIRELRAQLERSKADEDTLREQVVTMSDLIGRLKTEEEYNRVASENIRLSERMALIKASLQEAIQVSEAYRSAEATSALRLAAVVEFIDRECSIFNELVVRYHLDREVYESDSSAFHGPREPDPAGAADASLAARTASILSSVSMSIHRILHGVKDACLQLRIPAIREWDDLAGMSVLDALEETVERVLEHLGTHLGANARRALSHSGS